MLVDPELARWARELLREPSEGNGKGRNMSALGTHEITTGIGIGSEPPLSPPVVQGPNAMAMPASGGLSDLPMPPPAIRPPESELPAPVPAAEPQANVSPPEPQSSQREQQPEQPAEQPAQIEQASAPQQPEPELPEMAPASALQAPEGPHDYFTASTQTPEPLPEIAQVEQASVEAVLQPEARPTELVAPAPVEEQQAEIVPLVAPVESEIAAEVVQLPQAQPAELVAPTPTPVEEQPAEIVPLVAPVESQIAPEPAPAALEPVEIAEPAPVEARLDPGLPMPVAPLPAPTTPEPEHEQSHQFEAVDVALPVIELSTASEEAQLEEVLAPKHGVFRVVVRLKDSDGVEVGEFRDFGTAMEGAQEVIEQFANAAAGTWPFYAGRFIRPDLIVSVDVVEGDQD
jgi:hypothetical protein